MLKVGNPQLEASEKLCKENLGGSKFGLFGTKLVLSFIS